MVYVFTELDHSSPTGIKEVNEIDVSKVGR